MHIFLELFLKTNLNDESQYDACGLRRPELRPEPLPAEVVELHLVGQVLVEDAPRLPGEARGPKPVVVDGRPGDGGGQAGEVPEI